MSAEFFMGQHSALTQDDCDWLRNHKEGLLVYQYFGKDAWEVHENNVVLRAMSYKEARELLKGHKKFFVLNWFDVYGKVSIRTGVSIALPRVEDETDEIICPLRLVWHNRDAETLSMLVDTGASVTIVHVDEKDEDFWNSLKGFKQSKQAIKIGGETYELQRAPTKLFIGTDEVPEITSVYVTSNPMPRGYKGFLGLDVLRRCTMVVSCQIATIAVAEFV